MGHVLVLMENYAFCYAEGLKIQQASYTMLEQKLNSDCQLWVGNLFGLRARERGFAEFQKQRNFGRISSAVPTRSTQNPGAYSQENDFSIALMMT